MKRMFGAAETCESQVTKVQTCTEHLHGVRVAIALFLAVTGERRHFNGATVSWMVIDGALR